MENPEQRGEPPSGAVDLRLLPSEAVDPRQRRFNQVMAFAGSAGLAGLLVLFLEPTWPVAVGVAGIAIAMAIVCHALLRSSQSA